MEAWRSPEAAALVADAMRGTVRTWSRCCRAASYCLGRSWDMPTRWWATVEARRRSSPLVTAAASRRSGSWPPTRRASRRRVTGWDRGSGTPHCCLSVLGRATGEDPPLRRSDAATVAVTSACAAHLARAFEQPDRLHPAGPRTLCHRLPWDYSANNQDQMSRERSASPCAGADRGRHR